MATFRHEQVRVNYAGRVFQFVSYEATPGNAARQIAAMPDTWFLLASGHRWPAIPHEPGQPSATVIAQLIAWLEVFVFGSPQATPSAAKDGVVIGGRR